MASLKERLAAQERERMPTPSFVTEPKPKFVAPATYPPVPVLANWPELMGPAAYHGIAGDVVQAIAPHTEADPAALMVQFLVAFGNVIGRHAHITAEACRHYGNLFAVLVGNTSKGRKGSSWGHVGRLLQSVDPAWSVDNIASGLSSGEGLIWSVRDAIPSKKPSEGGDPGVTDKRLLAMEAEFVSALKLASREGNTLSAVIRNAWDSGDLRTMVKTSPARATGAHVSIIGHVTRDELRRYLTATEQTNGFGNRFLWVCVRRSRCLPEGGCISEVDFAHILRDIVAAADFARQMGEMVRDDDARDLWCHVYPELSEGKPGLLGGMTSRAEAQVMRLAMLFALLDRSFMIRTLHLQAALEVWRYCAESAAYIFGDSLGDKTADEIRNALRASPEGATRTQIRDLFHKNKSASEIASALALLRDSGLAHCVFQQSGGQGRPEERWFYGPDPTTKTT